MGSGSAHCVGCRLGHGGLVDVASETCPRHGSAFVKASPYLSSLGRQLTIAAGLCRAFDLGWRRGYERDGWLVPEWDPGCRLEAP